MHLPFSTDPQGRVHHLRFFLILLSLLILTPSLHADLLVVNNITYNDVRISAVRDGEVFFTITASGSEVHKPLASVSKIALTDEPTFTTAEIAYAAKQWDQATQAYEKTLRTTQKPWLKEWVSRRLLESANQAGQFDAAIKAYIALAEKSPESARTIKLLMPKPDSAYLRDAIKLVNTAIDRNKSTATQDTLFALLIELHKTRNDLKAANETLARQMALKAADPSTPEGARAAATLKLNALRLALQGKEYDKVIQLVEKDPAAFSEPADQAEALFCLAEAKAGKLGNSNNPAAWKDVALAYMQIVASAPASAPQIPAALMKVAAIHESHLGEKDTALRLYEQIATDYKTDPLAPAARQAAQRLKN